ncbi:MAG: hypothetical protein CFE28_06720 [Alphaproteobacteria bacterium PA2]|nr:MAG: hypothetical protein CFE28_06720 [Alphaproteobacteria bacterium PA2]
MRQGSKGGDMTDAAKAKVWDAYVEPYGQAKVFGTPSAGLDIRLPGQFLEAESGGLHQNWFRNYDPTLGRYIEADPLGIDAGQNPYAYVDGRPTEYSDPEGLIIPLIIEGALVGGGIDLGLQLLNNGGHFECVNWKQVGKEALIGAAFGGIAEVGSLALVGKEFTIAKNLRIAPFGNRTGHPTGELPHYHRSVPNPKRAGHSMPGQSMKRHRPWDSKPSDRRFLDRF